MKLVRIFYLISAVGIIISCNKGKLDPIPQAQLSDAVVFSSPQRVLHQVLGLYAGIKAGPFLGSRYLLYNDIRGEEFLNQTNNIATALLTWNFSLLPGSGEVNGLWSAIYTAVNRCNVVIKGISTAPIPADSADMFIAEARFIRALCYYALLTLYARPYWDDDGNKPGVPLRLKAETGESSNLLARSKVAEAYAQVLNDLDFAETNLPSDYATAYDRTTRAHRNTAIALKTRVYLSMRQYAKVIAEANKIVSIAAPFQASSGVPHKLDSPIIKVFSSPYTNLENIFSMPFATGNNTGTQSGLGGFYNPSPNGAGDYYLNPFGIVSEPNWKTNDARRMFNETAQSKIYFRKFPKSVGNAVPDWAPIVRYAEIMLNLAEALVRQNNTVDTRAVALLNAIRQRSDNTTTFAPANVASLLSLIETERRIELLGEGFRSIDIMRLGQDFPAKGVSPAAPAVPVSSHLYIWPIPSDERLLNTICVQNPGY
jgi:hypothetical protein